MALLLYKSNEMFSATELIRKSKMIFDKVVNNEIEKAIIMRDGKPGFLLMDFEKYENIMQEYETLKEEYEKLTKLKNKKKKNIKETKIESKCIEEEIQKIKSTPVKDEPMLEDIVIPKPKIKELEKDESIKIEVDYTKEPEVQEKQKTEPIDEMTEIREALDKIKNLNFNDEERLKVEVQVKERIKQARQERARILEQEEQLDKEDLKEELEIQVHLKEEKNKKERELKEFWD